MIEKEEFLKKRKKESMRDAFGQTLFDLMKKDERIVVLTADLAPSLRIEKIREEFPERFIEVGVAEQNMAGVAAGLAMAGKIPFICSFSCFSPSRNWEQIRTEIAYNNLPVKIIGSHSGLITGKDGFSHQSLEDIALMQVLPNMVVVSPLDALETKKAVKEIIKIEKPVYLRLVRPSVLVLSSENDSFEIGKGKILWQSEDFEKKEKKRKRVAIFGYGPLLSQGLLAAFDLVERDFSCRVISLSTIKPIDEEIVLETAREVCRIVVLEEHQKIGGLGATIAQILSERLPLPIKFVAVEDKFGQSGEPEELLSFYRLTKKDILEKILNDDD